MRTALAIALLVAGIAVVSWVGTHGQADAEPGFEVPRAPAPQQPSARKAVPTLDTATAEQVRSAPQGRVVAKGPAMVADEITSPTGRGPLVRLTITGDFPVRSLDFTVLVDGQPVGRGIQTENLDAIRVVLGEPRTGAVVSYQYGDGPRTTVGSLKAEGK
ncbi:hypothetical protein [Allokutzneria oryzae]|uniref:Uncharacterized protein n=1 Tax=Allokutzneria oryzae TaxID=1378989 RepID=A0ABV5ZVR3_9PSEU